jgi:proteasome lid subunit RPN8/RPN11
VVIAAALLKMVTDAAEAGYPDEACGLLVGRVRADDVILVSGVEPAPNVATARGARFEIDPRVRFALTRRLRGGALRVIGHYHSHPDLPALPSRHDLERAFEPDLIWLITSVQAGRAAETTASILDPAAKRFRRLALQVTG